MENWKKMLITSVLDAKKNHPGMFTVTSIIKAVCARYSDRNFNTLKSFYYMNLHKLSISHLEDLLSEDSSIDIKEVSDFSSNKHSIINYNKDCYRIGDIIKTKIAGYAPYGVFLHCLDNLQGKGLLHTSNIGEYSMKYVRDCSFIGMATEVELIDIDSKGRLCFSIRNIKNELRDRLEGNKNNLEVATSTTDSTSLPDTLSNTLSDNFYDTSEVLSIKDFISSHIGPLSPKAEEELYNIISEYGTFKFTLALSKILSNFNPDPSYQLLSATRNNLKEGL